jgi:hypothetical protein
VLCDEQEAVQALGGLGAVEGMAERFGYLAGVVSAGCARAQVSGGAARPDRDAVLVGELLPGPWPAADLVNIAAAGDAQVADFALETLETNGRNGGDRFLAWSLACNAFAGDSRFKAWVSAQLARPDQHGLILYNAAMIPQRWRDDPAFAQALGPYVDDELTRGCGPDETAATLGQPMLNSC